MLRFLIVCLMCPIALSQDLVALFDPEEITVLMNEYDYVDFNITGQIFQEDDDIVGISSHTHLMTVEWNSTYRLTQENVDSGFFQGRFRINAHFLGRADLSLEVRRGITRIPVNGSLPVTVLRPQRPIDQAFTMSVAIFVSLIFINFGCAMHWPTVLEVIKRPLGPAIGMCGQFLFMPLISFGLGFVLFPDMPAMRLGMFFTGVSPGGGASNIWTFILGGNLNLSLAMTSISTLASFGLMPAWIFSLGQVVFSDANIVIPYARIAYFVVGLMVPLGIGLAMQKFTPRIAGFMVKILKGFSTTLLLFIIIFAIVTNLYIFELFTWNIIVAGMGIPWLGYLSGYVVARLLRQPHKDAIAISIETGVQNMGIAVFLLRYALPQPEADLTTVVPVSVAIMTPIPMSAIFIYQRIRGCFRNRGKNKNIEPLEEPAIQEIEFEKNTVATETKQVA
ncbi:solute carrier family 10 member 6 [Pieris brassicae]|uniref:solute carrier family 10 member 6 n=1 Tax=Pieris brassicae TaxID=7116 RepID=UPI001E660343|nr:solute carrier family 10 member 6 [Pieris brassicae]XP_045516134.1 solute carrier family 10 member 6 [Pieris brassicae]